MEGSELALVRTEQTLVPSDAETKQDAAEALDKIGQFKKLLEAAGVYASNADKFIALEARTYIDAARLAGSVYETDIKPHQRRVIEWLCSLSHEQQEEAYQECVSGGIRLVTLMNYEKKNKDSYYCNKLAAEQVGKLVGEFVNNGEVTIPHPFYCGIEERAADGLAMRTRASIIRVGGVCIGDNHYVLPETHQEDLMKAITIRAKSIGGDLKSVYELYSMLDEEPDYDTKDKLNRLAFPGFTDLCDAARVQFGGEKVA